MHRKFLPPLLLALLSFGWSVAAQVHPTSGEVRLRSTNFADRLVRNVGDLGELLPAGNDNELDKAVELVPKLYRILSQGASDAPSSDAFREIAAGLSVQGGG